MVSRATKGTSQPHMSLGQRAMRGATREAKKRSGGSPPPPGAKKPKNQKAFPETSEINQPAGAAGQLKKQPVPSNGRRSSKRPSPTGFDAVGRRLKVYWPARKQWLEGIVTDFNEKEGTHYVKYDSGDEQWLTLKAKEDNRRLKWVDDQPLSSVLSGEADGNRTEAEQLSADSCRQEQAASYSSGVAPGGSTEGADPPAAANGAQFPGSHPHLRARDCGAVLAEAAEASATSNAPKKLAKPGADMVSGAAGEGRRNEVPSSCPSGAAEVCKDPDPKPGAGTIQGSDGTTRPSDGASEVEFASEAEIRAKAELAWLKTYEAVNKAVRMIQLTREGAPGDMAATPKPSSTPSPPSGLSSPTGRKAASTRNKPTNGGMEAAFRARVSVFWPGDKVYYKGRIMDFNKEKNMHCVHYDDNEEEWLNLSEEYFRWLGPRTRSGGYSHLQQMAMMSLGPEGFVAATADRLVAQIKQGHLEGPTAAHAVGWRLGILWEADGNFYEGEVLSYNPKTHKHHILFQDGEDEWVYLSKEVKCWKSRGRGPSRPAGLPAGEEAPKGRVAIGWRIGVYWKEDHSFYNGEIRGYDSATGKHHIHYDDNEDEYISLSTEKVKWMVPPGDQEPKPGPRRRNRSNYGRPVKKLNLDSVSMMGGTGRHDEPAAGGDARLAAQLRQNPSGDSDPAQRVAPGSAEQPSGVPQGGMPLAQPPPGGPCGADPRAGDGALSRRLRLKGCLPVAKGRRERMPAADVIQLTILSSGQQQREAVPRAAADAVDCGHGTGDGAGSLDVLKRMLWRVGAGRASLQKGIPVGSEACRREGCRVAEAPFARDSSREPVLPLSMQLPKAQPQNLQEHISAHTPRADLVRGEGDAAVSPALPTPTAFQLDELGSPPNGGHSPWFRRAAGAKNRPPIKPPFPSGSEGLPLAHEPHETVHASNLQPFSQPSISGSQGRDDEPHNRSSVQLPQ
uniref:Tudor domain-containing protein n=1 Tax=Tetraselmis sp. GSL018 TaxID=582737 RepID=A0A061QY62_9CHLO|eukprot:CAMPEP_0177612282 /NCGR_PEP_ID=MMETSP0419_2-20121207/21111_1 /TAXON_ID=582737 /ORGANISM="Tetraselmis sp., Strain GSL018" /LENGTH=956 /DNA_ID=CAMNT_0019108407 /DNA_START=559 /DNA_END=3429 /DNA_ORIENTATION=+